MQCHHKPTNRNSWSVAAESVHVLYVCVSMRDPQAEAECLASQSSNPIWLIKTTHPHGFV